MIGAYVQDEWRFAPRWMLNLGGRIDYESYGGFNPSGRVALSYQLTDDSTIYAAISEAYRLYPAATRFIDLPQFLDTVHVTANRSFEATPQLAYELGYRGLFLDKRLETTATAFWHEAKDELVYGPQLGPPGLIRQNFHNGPSSSLYGVELEGKYKISPKLTLLGNYTFQYFNWRGAEFTSATDSITPPTHKFAAGARYSPLAPLHLSAQLYYVDSGRTPDPNNPFVPLHIDSLLRVDLRAQYDFWKDGAFFAVGVRNLLDPHHLEGTSTFLNNAEVPRMIYAEIGMRLGR
jgi:outer membrane receptor protein involved in Fe transport